MSPSATPLASFQSLATETSVAVPQGGGDAPEVTAPGSEPAPPGTLAAIAAARATAVLAVASQLPGAEGAIVGDVVIISDFTSLMPTPALLAVMFCVCMMLAAFAAGW